MTNFIYLNENEVRQLHRSMNILLSTKLFTPRIRAAYLRRGRLQDQLEQGAACNLTLVSAPAGFGKTTQVAAWLDSKRIPVSWVALDEGDNDPRLFLAYLVNAVQRVWEHFGERALISLQKREQDPLLETLIETINEIAAWEAPITLVLDDFHLVRNSEVHDLMVYLIDHQPPNLRLIIVTREDPPWPLARYRARRELVEIRARDLRFSCEETGQLFNDVLKIKLKARQVEILDQRIEGWAAGLQIAAASLRDRKDKNAFIRSFSGSNRFIFDFLMEEVLAQRPEKVRRFLLETSILERMSAPLCAAVTGQQDSHQILTGLEQANLFVIALDDRLTWFRYHRLFSDLLRKRLALEMAEAISNLYKKASRWYEGNGLVGEAMKYALETDDLQLAVGIIERNALALAYHGEIGTLLSWLDMLPGEMVHRRGWLCIARIWAFAYAGKPEQAQTWLTLAEQTPQFQSERDSRETGHMRCHLALARAYLAAVQQDTSQMDVHLKEVQCDLPQHDVMARGVAMILKGLLHRWTGDAPQALAALHQAYAMSASAGEIHLAVDALWERSVLEFALGKLQQVIETCQHAQDLADEYRRKSGRLLPVMGYIHERMSTVLWEWNDLDAAMEKAESAVELSQIWGQFDALLESYFSLARIRSAVGDYAGAREILRQAKPLTRGLGAWYSLTVDAMETQLNLYQGDLASATEWLADAESTLSQEADLIPGGVFLLMGKIYLLLGRIDQAIEMIGRLSQLVEKSQGRDLEIRFLIYQALTYRAAKKEHRAVSILGRALQYGEPQGYMRSFIKEGAPLLPLLIQVASRGDATEYVRRIISGIRAELPEEQQATLWLNEVDVDALTDREMVTLRYLSTELSIPEIADELVIAVSTARTHVKNIYSKLGVHNRRDAVALGRQLKIL